MSFHLSCPMITAVIVEASTPTVPNRACQRDSQHSAAIMRAPLSGLLARMTLLTPLSPHSTSCSTKNLPEDTESKHRNESKWECNDVQWCKSETAITVGVVCVISLITFVNLFHDNSLCICEGRSTSYISYTWMKLVFEAVAMWRESFLTLHVLIHVLHVSCTQPQTVQHTLSGGGTTPAGLLLRFWVGFHPHPWSSWTTLL